MNKLKKITSIALAVLLVFASIPTINVSAAKIKLNKTKITIYVGKTVTLKVQNNKKKVKWTTSNKKIATVTKKGKVKGKKSGKATITATVGKKKYKCKITVKKAKNVSKPTKKPIKENIPTTTKQEEQTSKNNQQESTIVPETTTRAPEETTTKAPETENTKLNENDVNALQEIIKNQRNSGATVNTDVSNKEEYTWSDGRLISINWTYKKLAGTLDIT